MGKRSKYRQAVPTLDGRSHIGPSQGGAATLIDEGAPASAQIGHLSRFLSVD